MAGSVLDVYAQFKEKAFQQNYNEPGDSTSVSDSTAKLFSFKEWGRGLVHKQTIKVGTMFAGSIFAPGTAQIYNKDYWKLPVIYGGIGALAGTGGYYLHKYNQSKKVYDRYIGYKKEYEGLYGTSYPLAAPRPDTRSKTTGTWLMVGAGIMYWGSLLDGVACYQSDKEPLAGRATIYSVLLPGLGQIYNGELYKVPIYWGGLLISTHLLVNYNNNYRRFQRIYKEVSAPDNTASVNISPDTAKWYRDVYRRYRDYSIVATVLVYLLQVIDANVFAYMHDFEVSDEITMNFEPALIPQYNEYAMNVNPAASGFNALGMRIGIRF